jgi:hypothetical protein
MNYKKYRGKILMVKEHPLIKQFDMKINILVLINIFEKIFTNKELTFEDIFKFTKQDLPDYAKHALTEDALEVQDKEVKPIPILVRQPHRFMRKRVVKPKPTPPTLERQPGIVRGSPPTLERIPGFVEEVKPIPTL